MAEEDIIGLEENPHMRRKLEEVANLCAKYFSEIMEKNKAKKKELRKQKFINFIQDAKSFNKDLKKDLYLFKNRDEFKKLYGQEREQKKQEILQRLRDEQLSKIKEGQVEKVSVPDDLKKFAGLSQKEKLSVFKDMTPDQRKEFLKKFETAKKSGEFKAPQKQKTQTQTKQKGFTR